MKKVSLYTLFGLMLISMLFMFRPSSKVREELLSAEKLMTSSPDSALQALEGMYNEHFSDESKALYALLLTQAKFKNRQITDSDSLIKLAVAYYKDGKDSLRKAQSYFYEGRINANLNDAKRALICYQKASCAAISTNDYKLLKLIYNYWGLLLRKQNMYDDALIKLKKSLEYAEYNNDTIGLIFTLRDIGGTYFLDRNFSEALHYYKNALSLAEHIEDEERISDIYNNLSILFMEKGEYRLAMFYVNKSILLKTDSLAMLSRLSLKGDLFFREHNYDSARYYFNRGKMDNNISSKATYCAYMSELEEKIGNYKEALFYRNRYVSLTVSLEDNRRDNDIAELQKKYDYSLFENENNRLELERMSKNTIILSTIIVLLLVVWIYSYRYKKIRLEKDELVKAGKEQLDQMMDKLSEQVNELDQYRLKTETELKELREKALKMNEAIKKIDLLTNMDTNQRIKKKKEMALSDKEFENLLEVVNTCYDRFAERLAEQFPKLTEDNIYFCCLLKMRVSLEIISILLGVSEDSLTKRKYRIKRGQIELPKQYLSLDDFMLEF